MFGGLFIAQLYPKARRKSLRRAYRRGKSGALSYTPERPALQGRDAPKEQLALVAKAGSYAPSGMGKQSAKIIVVTNREVRDRLSRLNMNLRGGTHDPYYGAPAVIVVLADKSVPTYLYDGSVVMANMLNAAHALGLATCWVHGADQMFETNEGKELLKEWNIEGDYVGIAQCIIGYNDGDYPQPDPRKPDYITWIE